MALLNRGTHDIHYEVLGDGNKPPLLLLMGMAFSSRAWASLPRQLTDQFQVILLDNRGTGQSTRTRGLFTIADMADDAAAVLEAVGVAQAYVFGISMGGMVALELVLRHPGRIRGLVLGCTYAGWLRSQKPSVCTLWTLLAENIRPKNPDLKRLARFLVSAEHFAKDAAGFGQWLRQGEHAGGSTVLRQMMAASFHATERRLGQITAPTLVLSGDTDLLVPADNSRRLAARIPGAKLILLPGAGHCFPVEREAETVEAIRAFFDGLTRGARPESTGHRPGKSDTSLSP